MKNITSAIGFALLLASPWAAAQSQDSPSLYLQAGSGRQGAYTATLGVTLPWNWAHALGSYWSMDVRSLLWPVIPLQQMRLMYYANPIVFPL